MSSRLGDYSRKKAKELEVSLVGSGYSGQIAAGSQLQGNLAFALRYLEFCLVIL